MNILLFKNPKRLLFNTGLIVSMAVVQTAFANESSEGSNTSLGKTETKLILEGKPANDVKLPTEPKVIQYKWTLDDVRQIAENQNPDLKAAKANFDAAEKVVLEAWSGYLPHADIGGSFQQTTLPNPSVGLTNQIGIALPYSSVVGSIKQTLFDFGKTLNQIGAAKALSRSTKQDAIALKNAVDLNVQRTFYNVIASDSLVKVANQGLAAFEETHRRMTIFVKTGARPVFDLSQSNVQVAKAKLGVIDAVNDRDIARVLLLKYMGLPEDATFTLLSPRESKLIEAEKLSLPKLTALALQNRPEMQSKALHVEAAQMQLHQEVKGYLPTIGIEGWYGKFFPNYFDALGDAWGGGITLKWNLFDGFNTTARVGEFSARVEAQSADLEKEHLDIVAEVANSYMNLSRSLSKIQLAENTLVFANQTADLGQKRYDAGVATFLELLVAQNSLLDAQTAVVQAKFQYEIGLAGLATATNANIDEISKTQ